MGTTHQEIAVGSIEVFRHLIGDKMVDVNAPETVESLTQQLELVKKALKIAKAVGENSLKDLVTELAAQRKYITHLEQRCKESGVRIFVNEARDEV